ncbi:MAG: ParA family protein [Acetobacteraceae bacterium]|nr:ParA family protein [Acetobacteraceae bacterium]
MYVLALASQKGGAGKTTLSGHLSVAAEQAGFGPVVLVDTDPQHSLTYWWQARTANTPLLAQVDLANIRHGLETLQGEGAKLVIIDTPPAIAENIRSVVAAADLVLIPTRPSAHDLRAVGATVALVEAARRPMVFVVNGAANRAKITMEAVDGALPARHCGSGGDLPADRLCHLDDRWPHRG